MATATGGPSPDPPDRGAATQYDAFLSYSPRDEEVAKGLQKGLHRIGRRAGRLHALRVFRDKTDLAASPSLWGKITEAMDCSRYLIAVLSPQAAASEWVNKEVEYWLQHRGSGQLLLVLADGHLDWDDAQQRFDPTRSDAAPPILTTPGVLATEPIYVDVSGDAPWDTDIPAFRDKVVDLAAPIHGGSMYELESDDKEEQRRYLRLHPFRMLRENRFERKELERRVREALEVSSSVFAPPEVRPGQTFIVRVFAHLQGKDAEVESLARKFDASARPLGTDVLDSRVSEGEQLAFVLRLPGLLVDDPVQPMIWVGQSRSVQFGVTVPTDFTPKAVIGTVVVSRDSAPIGHVKFLVNVQPESEPAPPPDDLPHASRGYHGYRRAFISYASADRKEVLKRTQMLPSAGIDFFQDVLTLGPGQRWQRELYNEIDRCDLFLLFWSSAAKKSEWVLKEVHHAMKRNGGDELAPPEILPVVIEGPPPVPPPPELAHLHFDDRILYFMQPSRRKWRRLWRR